MLRSRLLGATSGGTIKVVQGATHGITKTTCLSVAVLARVPITLQTTNMATMSPELASDYAEDRAWHPPRPRRFRPLNPKQVNSQNATHTRLRGIVFDVDGTLCLPQNHMFRHMRSALQINKSVDILEHVRSLSEEPDGQQPTNADGTPSSPRSRAQEAIRQIERAEMTKQVPQPGLMDLMTFLENRRIPKALCTRNFPAPVRHLIQKFMPGLRGGHLGNGFDEIITRETEGIEPKPSPAGIWHIGQLWNLQQNEVDEAQAQVQVQGPDPLETARRRLGQGMIMVGDSIDDMAAGYRAGAATVLLVNKENMHLREREEVDLCVNALTDLIDVLDRGFSGRV